MEDYAPRVFLSHNSNDKAFVRKLAAELQLYGARVWLDEAEIKIGDSLIAKIQTAIHEVDFLVAVISQNSIDSAWVQQELEAAFTRQLAERRVILLPIVVEDVIDRMPLFLRGKLWGDFRSDDKFQQGVIGLVSSLGLGKSFRELLKDLSAELNAADAGRCDLRDVKEGRQVLSKLSTEPEMNIPEVRRAVLWKLLNKGLTERYPLDIGLGRYNGKLSFRAWDPLFYKSFAVDLTDEEFSQGIWQFVFDVNAHTGGIITPFADQAPLSDPGKLLVGRYRQPRCPTSVQAERQAERLAQLAISHMAILSEEMKRSLLRDLHSIVLKTGERSVFFRVGCIDLIECSTYQPSGGNTASPFFCSDERRNTLFFFVEDSFFGTRNSLFLCRTHREEYWDAEMDLLDSKHHLVVLGPH